MLTTYPESDTGKAYWDKIYKEVQKIAGTTNLPINTFSKIWIVPDEAEVYEKDNTALITHASLKVMTDEDYLAMEHQENVSVGEGLASSRLCPNGYNNKISNNLQINKIAIESFKQTILPKINKDVNQGKNFSKLRQIYNSIILGIWFKKKFQESIYKHYINKGKLSGIDLKDKQTKDKIYNLYVEAFKKGVYSYIKTDPAYNEADKPVRRKYHSGGILPIFGKVTSSSLTITNSPEYPRNASMGKVARVPIAIEYDRDSTHSSSSLSSFDDADNRKEALKKFKNAEVSKLLLPVFDHLSKVPWRFKDDYYINALIEFGEFVGDDITKDNVNAIIIAMDIAQKALVPNVLYKFLVSITNKFTKNGAVDVIEAAVEFDFVESEERGFIYTQDEKNKIMEELREKASGYNIKKKSKFSTIENMEIQIRNLNQEIGYMTTAMRSELSIMGDLDGSLGMQWLGKIGRKERELKQLESKLHKSASSSINLHATQKAITNNFQGGGIAMEGAGMGINPVAASSAISIGDFSNVSGIKFQILRIDYFKDVDSILNLL